MRPLLELVIWRVELNETEAWQKIAGFNGTIKLGRVGYIPVFHDDTWTWFKNTAVIWPGMEYSSDPERVDKLRQSAVKLLEAFPDTIPQLEKLGVRVKALLNKQIKTQEDVEAWADSIFNTGPTNGLPVHVEDALALANTSFKIVVQTRPSPQYVLPAVPLESESKATLDFNSPGSRTKFGPRHAFTKTAFSTPPPGAAKNRPEGSVRPRGRPRKDGLPPGSKEARAADKAKQRSLERARAKRLKEREQAKPKTPAKRVRKLVAAGAGRSSQHEPIATVTELPRRRLVRVGNKASGVGS
jgi:hypothetical protein